jgi:hypothetical protein
MFQPIYLQGLKAVLPIVVKVTLSPEKILNWLSVNLRELSQFHLESSDEGLFLSILWEAENYE